MGVPPVINGGLVAIRLVDATRNRRAATGRRAADVSEIAIAI
jgi:hypothetical protein